MGTMAAPHADIALSEVLAALSTALDLTEGQPAGHSVRTCVIGCRLAEEIGLGVADRSALYYALLLKDAGCSSNAARFAALFGTRDQDAKHRMKLVDWHRRVRLAIHTFGTAGHGGTLRDRLHHFLGIARTEHVTRDLIQTRCDRGAEIVAQMGFPAATADAIRALDEHWCGAGYPAGLRGDAIPLLARIANLAQTVELFFTESGRRAALRVVRQRRGTWFDPALADRVLSWRRDDAWWRALETPDLQALVVALEPSEHVHRVDDSGLDVVARAFADIIDAKSPYTFRHSSNVAEYARGIAAACGLGAGAQRRLYRAGLLHDIGKLGVSSRILDSPARLSDDERREVERHPAFTWEILQRVGAFRSFAWLAATHHEKLDGSGYPWRLRADVLDLPARILVVADIYEALTADRPYRAGMPHDAAMAILVRERGPKLCADALDGLAAWAERREAAA
jgi:HD-GYP domain-containing protein (c-di-GMP phosphodiesterase class II)